MRYRGIERAADAFQQPVDADTVGRLCRRALGSGIATVTELPWGSYNSVYRVDLDSGDPVVLRIAPEHARQFRAEAALMRNEYAAVPYLAPVGDLLPRILFADFTHELIDRDYLVVTLLPGTPAPEAVGRYPRHQWAGLFEQLGAVARRIHRVPGRAFGPVAGPWFDTWSAALIAYFDAVEHDVRQAGYDATDVRQLVLATERLSPVLDEITQPRLLHGDGWTGNVLVDPASPERPDDVLTVTGLCDWDRAEWGDPLADWAIQRALERPGTEREAFWTGYGQPRSVAAGVRQPIYRARLVLGLRLDRIRSGRADLVDATYDELGELLGELAARV